MFQESTNNEKLSRGQKIAQIFYILAILFKHALAKKSSEQLRVEQFGAFILFDNCRFLYTIRLMISQYPVFFKFLAMQPSSLILILTKGNTHTLQSLPFPYPSPQSKATTNLLSVYTCLFQTFQIDNMQPFVSVLHSFQWHRMLHGYRTTIY